MVLTPHDLTVAEDNSRLTSSGGARLPLSAAKEGMPPPSKEASAFISEQRRPVPSDGDVSLEGLVADDVTPEMSPDGELRALRDTLLELLKKLSVKLKGTASSGTEALLLSDFPLVKRAVCKVFAARSLAIADLSEDERRVIEELRRETLYGGLIPGVERPKLSSVSTFLGVGRSAGREQIASSREEEIRKQLSSEFPPEKRRACRYYLLDTWDVFAMLGCTAERILSDVEFLNLEEGMLARVLHRLNFHAFNEFAFMPGPPLQALISGVMEKLRQRMEREVLVKRLVFDNLGFEIYAEGRRLEDDYPEARLAELKLSALANTELWLELSQGADNLELLSRLTHGAGRAVQPVLTSLYALEGALQQEGEEAFSGESPLNADPELCGRVRAYLKLQRSLYEFIQALFLKSTQSEPWPDPALREHYDALTQRLGRLLEANHKARRKAEA